MSHISTVYSNVAPIWVYNSNVGMVVPQYKPYECSILRCCSDISLWLQYGKMLPPMWTIWIFYTQCCSNISPCFQYRKVLQAVCSKQEGNKEMPLAKGSGQKERRWTSSNIMGLVPEKDWHWALPSLNTKELVEERKKKKKERLTFGSSIGSWASVQH